MSATSAGIYKSGFCTTGAAAWSPARCSHTYGHPPYEATCTCTCHDLTGARVDAAFATAVADVRYGLADRINPAHWWPVVAANLQLDLHAAYGDIWDLAIEPVAVPR